MKKLLLTTTALAMGFGVSGAYAMGNAEIDLSGSSKWTYSSSDDGSEDSGGENDTSFAITNSITVASSAASDSGLTFGTSLTLETGGGAVNDDGMKLFIKGPFGEIRTGSGGAGDVFGVDADGKVDGESQKVKGKSVAKAGDSSITYFTPSISGFEAGLSYTDAGTASKADSTELGISFTTDVGGNALKLNFANASTSGNGDDNASAATGSSDDQSYGLSYSLGDLSLIVAINSSETEDAGGTTTAEYEALGLGLGYKVNDALTFGLYSVSEENKVGDVETDEVAASLTYVIAPGLTTNLAYTSWDQDDDSGSTTAAYIKVAF